MVWYNQFFSTNLPPNERLDDLVSLLQLDAKNIDVEKLIADAIKEEQHINLKFSSDKVAVIAEDQAQWMLARVNTIYFSAHLNVHHIHLFYASHSNAITS